MPIRITGLNSGLDTEAIISALVSSYNYKTDKYKKAQTKLSWKQDAWKTLNTKIYSLYTNIGNLRFSTAYNLKSTKVSDSTKASVTASSSAPTGTQKLKILEVAQAGYLTGGKLDSSTTTKTTLAELGYTGGDGKINLTMGDGTKKEITVTQGTTVASFITSLKEAGVSANYDETNNRIFISSKSTGKNNDFTLTGANVDGANALYSLGLNVSSDATSATYESYTKYLTTDYTGSRSTIDLEDNVKAAIAKYQDAQNAYKQASAENSNLTAAYEYANAYSAMKKALKDSGLSATDQDRLQTLLGMSASGRVNSVMDADGKVYTSAGTDKDGNAIYSYGEGSDTKYIKQVITYEDASDGTISYRMNTDKTLKDSSGKVYTATGKTDTGGNAIYKDEDDNEISVKTTTSYYEASERQVGTDLYKITDADGNVYEQQEVNGSYIGTDGKTYRLDVNSNELIEIDAEGNDVVDENGDSNKVSVAQSDQIMETVYDSDTPASDINKSSDVLTDLKTAGGFDDKTISTLTSNISKVNAYEAVKDTVLDSTSAYTRQKIADGIKAAYASGGAAGVTAYTNDFAKVITNNKDAMGTAQDTMDEHKLLAKMAGMDNTSSEYTAAVKAFATQVNEANAVLTSDKVQYNKDAKKIDGTDSKIALNGIEYTSDKNTYSINGLSITAQQVTGEDEADAITITTSTDTQGIYDKIKDFLTQYNALINEITSLYNADSAKGYEPLTDDEKDAMSDTEIAKWEEKIKDSLLRRDDSLESIMNAMTSSMSKGFEINGKKYYLSNFGIKTLGYLNAPENEQYAYHIDGDEDDASTSGNADKLMAAITSAPDTVVAFMQKLATSLYDAVGDKMKSTTLSSAYTVYNDKEMASEYSDYTDIIKKWEEKLQEKEDYYYNKFSAMETALSKLNSQSSSLSGLLGG